MTYGLAEAQRQLDQHHYPAASRLPQQHQTVLFLCAPLCQPVEIDRGLGGSLRIESAQIRPIRVIRGLFQSPFYAGASRNVAISYGRIA